VPYFRAIGTGKSAAAHFGPVPNLHYAVGNFGRYLATVAPIAGVLFWQRTAVFAFFRSRWMEARILLAFIVAPSVCFLVLAAPEFVQYKALMLTSVAMGILGGVALGAIYGARPMLAFAIVVPLWVPMAADLQMKIGGDWRVTDPCRAENRYLVHADPDQQQLYAWLATQTSERAAVIDSYLTVPAFA